MLINIAPYNPNWPLLFNKEAEILWAILGDTLINIYHIGSTAIPGMDAKPIIDIMPVVYDITKVDMLNMPGYQAMGEYGIPSRRYFRKESENIRTHNIHFYSKEHPEIKRCLYFRDYLRINPKEAATYIELKKRLAMEFPNNMDAYTKGKNEFVRNIMQQGRFLPKREEKL